MPGQVTRAGSRAERYDMIANRYSSEKGFVGIPVEDQQHRDYSAFGSVHDGDDCLVELDATGVKCLGCLVFVDQAAYMAGASWPSGPNYPLDAA